MAVVEMAIRGGASRLTSSSSSSPTFLSSTNKNKVHFSRPSVLFLPASTSISLLSLFTVPPLEAKAATIITKDQIVSSLTQVEKTIDQVQELGSGFFDNTLKFLETASNALKPAMDVAMPLAQQAGEEALVVTGKIIILRATGQKIRV